MKRILIRGHIIWEHSTYSLSPIPHDVAESKETYEITLTCLKQRIPTMNSPLSF